MNRFKFGRKVSASTVWVMTGIVVSSLWTSANSATAGNAVLIAFGSDHCGHCTAMVPTLRELERQGIPIRSVNVDQEQDFARRHGVRQVPTFVVWSAGKELTRLVGAQSSNDLRHALALDSTGPLIQTDASIAAPASRSMLDAPRTRLAPVPNTHPSDPRLANDRPAASIRMASSARSEPFPSNRVANATQRARAATVRLRVHDGRGFGVGTGTIIDRHGEESLVLTCGHLFRETKLNAKIDVDLFYGGQIRTVPGKVIDYDADERDIALVVIRPGVAIEPVAVLPQNEKPQSGQSVFSFGCDHGDDPSRRDTRLTGINKYNQHLGASNLEIAGAPVDGRSGGGLFDGQGRLIGVCNAADYNGDVGIYTGPGSVYWQLDRLQLSRLYQARNQQASHQSIAADQASTSEVMPGSIDPPLSPAPADKSVVVIVPDPNSSEGKRVLQLNNPSAELMRMIERQASLPGQNY